ncbi:MAG: hypothetical protein ACYS6K_05925 [Planctomycetota bacterium]|jgi:hypothetical protein
MTTKQIKVCFIKMSWSTNKKGKDDSRFHFSCRKKISFDLLVTTLRDGLHNTGIDSSDEIDGSIKVFSRYT